MMTCLQLPHPCDFNRTVIFKVKLQDVSTVHTAKSECESTPVMIPLCAAL